ncbi:hypothetical protein Tco_0923154 [Tanacetum coccineum]|uniref:Uncharacterized protein n=1 Tax=Tanacetum coccineum TaxID=301880 RepID=A0ABQ5D064_9ASTR
MDYKGKGISQSTNDDALKKIMLYIEEGGSAPNLSSLKHVKTAEEGPMTLEEAKLKTLGFTEWLELHNLASKSQGAIVDQLLKNLKAKFKWIDPTADKLGITSPPQLTDFEFPRADLKRKRIAKNTSGGVRQRKYSGRWDAKELESTSGSHISHI